MISLLNNVASFDLDSFYLINIVNIHKIMQIFYLLKCNECSDITVFYSLLGHALIRIRAVLCSLHPIGRHEHHKSESNLTHAVFNPNLQLFHGHENYTNTDNKS